jgi:ABC-type glycerol-3-phosphate transport system substrate-binding protein
LEIFQWDGTLWALPAYLDMQVIYYNKELFDTAKEPYPEKGWSWDEFLATADHMTTETRQGNGKSGYYGLVSNPRWGDFVPFFYQHGADISNLDDPLLAEAIQWYADLSLVHQVNPHPNLVPDGDTYGFFREQKAAMWIGFLSDRDGLGFHHLANPWSFEWGILPLPRGPYGESTLYRAQGYYISAHCQNVAETWKWIRFLSQHPLEKGLPAHRDIARSDRWRILVGDEVAAAAIHASEHLVPRIASRTYPPDLLEVYARTVESIVNDGNRSGFNTSPPYLRALSLTTESVMLGETTAAEGIIKLHQQYGK